jgi:hypothetical protein
LSVFGVIRFDCKFVFLLVYKRKHYKYPVLNLYNSKGFIPNFETFSG